MMNDGILNDLTLEERGYLENYITTHRKSPLVTWLLWFFLGIIGGHRMYMNRVGSGVAMFLLWWPGWLLLQIPNVIWWLVDAFQINQWVKETEEKAQREAIDHIQATRRQQARNVNNFSNEQYD